MAIRRDSGTTGISPDTQAAGSWARYVNALIGAWLFISAFAWGHSIQLREDTWIVGLLMFIVALVAIAVPAFRWVNTALAVWLFISTLALGNTSPGTLWNNIIVAVVVFLLSLTPSTRPHTSSTSARPGT